MSKIFSLIQNGIYSKDLKPDLMEIKAEFERLRGMEKLATSTADLLKEEQRLDSILEII